MYNHKLYRQFAAGMIGMILFVFAGIWLVVTDTSLFAGTLCIGLFFFISFELLHLLNATNRKVAYFFEAVKNNDSAIRYPEEEKDPYLKMLYKKMNVLLGQSAENQMKIEERTRYYETILHQLPVGIITTTVDGEILAINPAARDLLQCSPLVRLQQIDAVEKGLYNVFSVLPAGERTLIRISNEREIKELSLTASCIQSKNAYIRLYTIQDIKKELNDREADSWIRLIRVLTHEMMNSLAPITSLSDDLLTHIKETDEQQLSEGLEVIREQGKNLIAFINSYHSLTHLPVPQKSMIPLKEIIDKIALLLAAEPGYERICFNLSVPDTCTVYADKNLLVLVLINLIKNALQATASLSGGKVKVTAFLRAGLPVIQIIDNGKGIPPDLLEEIFVPFFTTRPDGNGIGLSISRQIMRLHGGHLEVTSREGEGSIFSICF